MAEAAKDELPYEQLINVRTGSVNQYLRRFFRAPIRDNYHLLGTAIIGDQTVFHLRRNIPLFTEGDRRHEKVESAPGNPVLTVGEKIDAVLYLLDHDAESSEKHNEDIAGHFRDLLKHFGTANPSLLQSCKDLLTLVRLQNGNLHEDVNVIQKAAEEAIADAEGDVDGEPE